MLTLVPTPIGNIGDITLRAMEALSGADILLCEDTRVTKKLLHILQERYALSLKENQRFISLHSHNEKEFLDSIEVDFFAQNVVYVSDAGMPGISDPGQMLVDYAIENALEYDILPGANAALTAFVACGFNEVQMLFFGFLPHKGSEREMHLNSALYSGYTTVLYESPHRIEKLLQEIAKLEPQREIFVAKELTKKFQTFYRGKAANILGADNFNTKGEWVVVLKASKTETTQSAITKSDIISLDLPKKTQAKLLSKITNKSIKECYEELVTL